MYPIAFLQSYVSSFVEAIQSLGVFAYIGAFLVVVVANFVCIPVTAVCAVVCGLLFGAGKATALVVSGIALGATFLLVAVRHYRAFVYQHFLPRASILAKDLRQFGWTYLLILHILPGIPTCLISIAAALGSVTPYGFFFVTLVGSAPGIAFLTITGEHLKYLSNVRFTLPPAQVALLIGLAAIIFFAYMVSKRWYGRQ